MDVVMPLTISLVMAVVAGALVWLVWSVIENLRAKRNGKKAPANPENGAKDVGREE